MVERAKSAHDRHSALAELVMGFSIEATPRQIEATPTLGAMAPPGTSVYVPFLPGSTFTASVAACRRLDAMGLRPVPHLAARAISGRAELDDVLARFVDAGVDSMLLIAGDVPRAAGIFANTLDILDSGLLADHGLLALGIAGHPEGHRLADMARLTESIRIKAAYARETGTRMWLVTQFVFAAAPFIEWDAQLRLEGVTLPARIGLPGPARVRTLLAYAMQCGVGASAQVLRRRPGLSRLLGRWTPELALNDLAEYRARTPESQLGGLHVFPFGGLANSLRWLHTFSEQLRTVEGSE